MDDYTAAPRWRTWAAGLLDVGLVGAFAWVRGRGAGGAGAAANRLSFLRLIPAEALREQIGTPGQRLLGVRTVDRRTGKRVALWRTVLLTGVAVGSGQLAKRLAPGGPSPEEQGEREDFLGELRTIHQRHPVDSPERRDELGELWARHPSPVVAQLGSTLAPSLAAGLLTTRLRRRLAPTIEVLVRGRRA